MLDTCRPLRVAVDELEVKEEVLRGWQESKQASYKGIHGLKIPIFGQ
jgi:uncharacterized protein